MRIYLIGFMGSGKSYTGKRLAQLMSYRFLDLDEVIVENAQKSIRRIFEEEGEAHFRVLEKNALRDTGTLVNTVISCGGGAPCFYDNIDWINEYGLSIYLEAAPRLLVQRLLHKRAERPLLKDIPESELLAQITAKLQAREACYLKAAAVFRQNQLEEAVAEQLHRDFLNIIGH